MHIYVNTDSMSFIHTILCYIMDVLTYLFTNLLIIITLLSTVWKTLTYSIRGECDRKLSVYVDTRKDRRFRVMGGGWGTYFGTLRQLDKGDDNYYSTLWMDGNSERDGGWAPRVEVRDIYRPVRFSFRIGLAS